MAQWRKVTMREAILYIRDECGRPLDEVPEWEKVSGRPNYQCDIEWFDNGTAVACESEWSGPYSEMTPDVNAEPPNWWIYC